MTELELCWGTVLQAGFAELIDAAAHAGFDAVTVNPLLVLRSGLAPADIRALIADSGVRVSNLDALVSVLPGLPSAEFVESYGRNANGVDVSSGYNLTEDDFYRTAEMTGADSINVVHFLGDPETPLESIARAMSDFSRRAAANGLRTVFEFLPATAVPDINTVARLVEMVDEPNFGIMLDTRHLAHSGGTAADVVNHAHLIGATQFSDLRWAARDEDDRLLPGDGELPLQQMLLSVKAAVPLVPIGVEVFGSDLFALHPREAAKRAAKAMRRIM